MPLRIRGLVDYSGCGPRPKPIVFKEGPSRTGSAGRVLKPGLPWSEAEKRKLRELCASERMADIAKHFPTRTYGAVSHMISFLKIERRA